MNILETLFATKSTVSISKIDSFADPLNIKSHHAEGKNLSITLEKLDLNDSRVHVRDFYDFRKKLWENEDLIGFKQIQIDLENKRIVFEFENLVKVVK